MLLTLKTIIQTWKKASKDTPNASCYQSEELEFMPAVLEITETPPDPIHGRLLYFIIILFISALAWSILGRMDVITTGMGKLVPGGYVKVIQSADGGIVQSIKVKDGDKVSKGDILIQFKQEDAIIARNKAHSDLMYQKSQVAYQTVYLNHIQKGNITPQMFSQIPAKQQAFYRQRLGLEMSVYKKTLESINHKRKKIKTDIQIANSRIIQYEKRLEVLNIKHKSITNLYKQKMKSKLEYKQSEQNILGVKQGIITQQQMIQGYQYSIRSLDADENKIRNDFENKAINALINQKERLKQSELNHQSASEVLKRTTITSPIDGVIEQLQVHTIGGVVKPVAVVATVVPHNTPLLAEVFIQNKDIGFVKVGQAVKVKIDSFQFTKYGYMTGKIKFISTDAQNHEHLGTAYKVKIALDTQTLTVNGQAIPLTAGMSLVAEIKTGKRRIIEYILSPLMKIKDEAFGER